MRSAALAGLLAACGGGGSDLPDARLAGDAAVDATIPDAAPPQIRVELVADDGTAIVGAPIVLVDEGGAEIELVSDASGAATWPTAGPVTVHAVLERTATDVAVRTVAGVERGEVVRLGEQLFGPPNPLEERAPGALLVNFTEVVGASSYSLTGPCGSGGSAASPLSLTVWPICVGQTGSYRLIANTGEWAALDDVVVIDGNQASAGPWNSSLSIPIDVVGAPATMTSLEVRVHEVVFGRKVERAILTSRPVVAGAANATYVGPAPAVGASVWVTGVVDSSAILTREIPWSPPVQIDLADGYSGLVAPTVTLPAPVQTWSWVGPGGVAATTALVYQVGGGPRVEWFSVQAGVSPIVHALPASLAVPAFNLPMDTIVTARLQLIDGPALTGADVRTWFDRGALARGGSTAFPIAGLEVSRVADVVLIVPP